MWRCGAKLDGPGEGWSTGLRTPRKPGCMAALFPRHRSRSACLAIFALLLVCLPRPALAVDTPSAAISTTLVERGIEAAARGDFDDARRLFERAIAANPANARAYAHLGGAHQSADDPRLARKYYGIALAIDPTDPDALSRLAQLEFAEGDRAAANEKLRILRFHCATCPQTEELARTLDSAP